MTLVLIAAIGPAKHAGVREADLVFELGAIDRRLWPLLRVAVVSSTTARRLMKSLNPLEHLNFTLQSVWVLSHHPEVHILQIDLVMSLSGHMNQLEQVTLQGLITVDWDALVLNLLDGHSVMDSPSLVPPKDNQWD